MKLNFIPLSLLAITLIVCSCSETKKDNQIDPQIKNQIHILNNRIVDGLVHNKPEIMLPLVSDKLLNRKKELIKLSYLLKGTLKKHNFRILNEYYQKNEAKKNEAVVSSGAANNNDYQIHYESLNKEMYVVVAYFQDSMYQKSFVFIYGKYGHQWKLNTLEAGIIKIANKNALDWYRQAKSEYEKGYLIDAMCHIGLSTQLLKPANHMWHYQKEKEMLAFEQKVTKQTYSKYNFPLTVHHVETKPVIFRIHSQVLNEGCFPMIDYITTINLGDVRALTTECNAMHAKIEQLFKGITTNNKTIVYRPLKSIPTGTDTDNKYVFMMETH